MYLGAVWPQHKCVINIGVNIHLSCHAVSKAKSSEWSVRMLLTACDTEVPINTRCVCWKKLSPCNYIVLLSQGNSVMASISETDGWFRLVSPVRPD